MEDLYYEKLFNIKTTGEQQGFYESHHYNRYEATSYLALETLFKEYCVNDKDSVVDFGCGKGRLPFYINYYYNSYQKHIKNCPFIYKLMIFFIIFLSSILLIPKHFFPKSLIDAPK